MNNTTSSTTVPTAATIASHKAIVVEAMCLKDRIQLLDCWVQPVLNSRLCSARLCAAAGDLEEARRLLKEVSDFLPVWGEYLMMHRNGRHILDQKDLNGMDIEVVKALLKEAGVEIVPPGPGGKGCIKFK